MSKLFAILVALFLVTSPAKATTIAYDGKTLAADSQATLEAEKTFESVKIARSEERHAAVAVAGNALWADLFMKYFLTTDKPIEDFPLPEPKDSDDVVHILIIFDNGTSLFFGGSMKAMSVVHAPFVMGTGGRIALGAMLAGKTAAEAVELAKSRDLYTGGPVRTIKAPKK